MGYLILALFIVIAVTIIWAMLERNGKKKAIKKWNAERKKNAILQKQLDTLRDNVDQVLDYNSEDRDRRNKINKHIEVLKNSKKEKEVLNELENIRADIHDALATL